MYVRYVQYLCICIVYVCLSKGAKIEIFAGGQNAFLPLISELLPPALVNHSFIREGDLGGSSGAGSWCLHTLFASQVFRSKLTLEEDGKAISGAKLVDGRRVKVRDVTFCVRFNFKLLGNYEGRSQLIHIEDWKTEPKVESMKIIDKIMNHS